ncbi:MAG: radical SAM protein [Methylobacter sp.]|nr:radical SAM protein [Methylobacter sp.]
MKVCLIFVPAEHDATTKDWAFRDDGVGIIPPLSLLYVAGILEKAGAEVQIIDVIAERLSFDQALERVKLFAPDLLGYTLNTYSFHPILSWINRFKEETGLPVIVGGAHVTLYPEETMSHQAIDYVLIGEADLPLPEFVQAFRDKTSFHGIKSLGFREDGKLFLETSRQVIANIDESALPARHLIRNELYYNILSKRGNFTAMMSTRGCPYRCTFCDQKTPPYRVRSAQNFVDEIKYIYHEFGIREFDIYDSTFTADRKRVIEICDLLVKENLDIGWTVRSTLMAITHEVLDALKRGGCHTIMYGVETSNQEILKQMRKKIRPEVVWDRINYTHKIGIRTLGFFMFGYPGETKETIEDTIRLSLALPLDYAQFTVLVPFPDTEIYDYYRTHSDLGDYWSEVTKHPEKLREIELLDTKVTRAEASELLGKAYRKFYFRPRIIWRRFVEMKSGDEFRRLARAAIGILKNSIR